MRRWQQEKRETKRGKGYECERTGERKSKEREDRREVNGSREQRCALYRKMDVSSCPVLPKNPSNKQLQSGLTTVASPGCFYSLSFIHSSIFPLLRCFKPTNYHQLPPDGLCPCSCFSWLFKQLCINKPVVTNKKGGERWLFKALLRDRKKEREREPMFYT